MQDKKHRPIPREPGVAAWIRVIGDPVLQKPGLPFPAQYSEDDLLELSRQITICRSRLIQAGGGGIAANQCAEIDKPFQLTIVGVFYESQTHRERVNQRYPDANFPQAMVMLNPMLIASSQEMQGFSHGCLSVPGSNRCEVQSPQTLRVKYLDPLNALREVESEVSGKAAIALWHELNHILAGQTYIDTSLQALSPDQLTLFTQMVSQEQHMRKVKARQQQTMSASFHHSIFYDAKMQLQIDKNSLEAALAEMGDEPLEGLQRRCQYVLKKTTGSFFDQAKSDSPANTWTHPSSKL